MTPITFNFDWDPVKAKLNRTKHRIRFEQAATIFRDPSMVTIFDAAHSLDEERWITIGRADEGDLLVVVHTFREVRNHRVAIRLISARRATNRERRQYEVKP